VLTTGAEGAVAAVPTGAGIAGAPLEQDDTQSVKIDARAEKRATAA
jgi:hypothetical protein